MKKKVDNPSISLVEQAKQLSQRSSPGISAEYRQRAEVYIAWLNGEIDTVAVAKVLGLTHSSAIAQKAGTTLRNCMMAGVLKVVWRKP